MTNYLALATQRDYYMQACERLAAERDAALKQALQAGIALENSVELRSVAIAERDALQADALRYRDAIATVCEGWSIPNGVRNILETALFNTAMAKETP